MKLDTIVKGGTVVTPGGTFVGDVGIAGEKIAALGSALDAPGARTIDAADHYVIPGVLDVHVPPGKTEPRHRHPHGLSVYFSDWNAKVTVDGREPAVNQRTSGTFAWSDAVIHTVENVSKSEAHVLRIELKY